MFKRAFINQKLKEVKKGKIISQKINHVCGNKADAEFIDRTNRALERMDSSDMKGLSKEGFLKELKSW